MSIKKLEDGRYLLDIRPNGRKGKRVRKVFDKKSVAVATERYIMANAEKREYIQGYRDRRTLNDLLELWWMYHGQHRRKAEEDRKQLRNIINELGADMQAVDLDKLKIIAWRSQKIADGLKQFFGMNHRVKLYISVKEYKPKPPRKKTVSRVK